MSRCDQPCVCCQEIGPLERRLAQTLKERDEAREAKAAEHIRFVLMEGIGKACEKMRAERDALRAAIEPTGETVRALDADPSLHEVLQRVRNGDAGERTLWLAVLVRLDAIAARAKQEG